MLEEYIRDDLKIHSAVRTAKFIASRLDCLVNHIFQLSYEVIYL